MSGNTTKDKDKRSKFRKLILSFKMNDNNRLCVNNPYNNLNDKDKYYNIPLENEKNNLILDIHNKNNHYKRDATLNYIKAQNCYWEGLTKDIQETIKSCPYCIQPKKFIKLNGPIKIIYDNGPHYRYAADLWQLPYAMQKITNYKFVIDIIDHFRISIMDML